MQHLSVSDSVKKRLMELRKERGYNHPNQVIKELLEKDRLISNKTLILLEEIRATNEIKTIDELVQSLIDYSTT